MTIFLDADDGRWCGVGTRADLTAALIEALPEALDTDGLVMLAAVVAGCEPGDVMICETQRGGLGYSDG